MFCPQNNFGHDWQLSLNQKFQAVKHCQKFLILQMVNFQVLLPTNDV